MTFLDGDDDDDDDDGMLFQVASFRWAGMVPRARARRPADTPGTM